MSSVPITANVMAASLGASVALLAVFFGVLGLVPAKRSETRVARMLVAVWAAVLAWFLATWSAQRLDLVTTEEAGFHHLYVLATVGFPVAALVLLGSQRRSESRSPEGKPRAGVSRLGVAVAVLFLIPGLLGVWGTHVEPQWLRVDRIDIAKTESPIRIGVLTDIQTDRVGDWEHDVVEQLNAQQPDLVVVVGDLTQVDARSYQTMRPDLIELLAQIEAPHGVFVVSGNTDPSSAEVAAVAADVGAVALHGREAVVRIGSRSLRLGGIAWPNDDADAVAFVNDFVDGASPETIDVLLAHSPDVVTQLAGEPLDLVIAGHTHGGQIALPFLGPLWNVTELPDSVAAGGLHEYRRQRLYVSTGVGVQRGESPKVRIGVRPSIAVLSV